MIDLIDEVVMEWVLIYCQGKLIFNLINFEDGFECFEKVVFLVQCYGCVFVVGFIDEKGMVVLVECKFEVVKCFYEIFMGDYGIELQDIWWDLFVFLCGIGDENYFGLVKVMIDGVCEVKVVFFGIKMIFGVLNVSFGLFNVGCEVLNLVFFFYVMCVGFDIVIVNMQKFVCYVEILQEECEFVEMFLEFELGDVEGGE